jgi:hypothetical protein
MLAASAAAITADIGGASTVGGWPAMTAALMSLSCDDPVLTDRAVMALQSSPMRLTPLLAAIAIMATTDLAGQSPDSLDRGPRRLTAAETFCDSTAAPPQEPVFVADSVDRPVEPRRLAIEDMPIRISEVTKGRSVFRFIVGPSGHIEPCSIQLVDETSRAWSEAVLKELRVAHYSPGRKAGKAVRQEVYQVFTYYSDGRMQQPR